MSWVSTNGLEDGHAPLEPRRINSSDDEGNQKMKESIELINATITTVRKICHRTAPQHPGRPADGGTGMAKW